MRYQIHRIIDCQILPPYSLKLKFGDGLTSVIDLERVLEGEIYGPLRNPTIFSKVMIDPEVQTVIWPNGADFDPAVLHDWPLHSEPQRFGSNRRVLKFAPRRHELRNHSGYLKFRVSLSAFRSLRAPRSKCLLSLSHS